MDAEHPRRASRALLAAAALVAIAAGIALLGRGAATHRGAQAPAREMDARSVARASAGSWEDAPFDEEDPEEESEPHGPGRIAGVVVDEAGSPTPATVVIIDSHAPREGARSVETTADGTFDTEIAAGKWDVHAERTGEVSGSGTVHVGGGGHTVRVRLVLQRAGRIEGIVRDGEGRPLPGATIVAYCNETWVIEEARAVYFGGIRIPQACCARAESDEHGRFSMSTPPGQVTLHATAEGTTPASQAVTIEASRVAEVEIRLTAWTYITGRVTDRTGRPIAGAELMNTNFQGGIATTGADGRYRVQAQAGNKVVGLMASAPGFTIEQAYWKDAEPGPVEFVLERAGVIRGVVRRPDGSPAAGATVGQYTSPTSQVHFGFPGEGLQTSEDGTFELRDACLGRCVVMAQLEGFAVSPSAPLDLAEGATIEGVVVTLVRGACFRGRVLDASTKQPLTKAHIERLRENGSNGWQVDAEGCFRFEFLAPGHHVHTFTDGEHAGQRLELDLADGDDVDREILLEKGCRVTLRAVTADGIPLKDRASGGGRLDAWGSPGWGRNAAEEPVVTCATPGVYAFYTHGLDSKGRGCYQMAIIELGAEAERVLELRLGGGNVVRGRAGVGGAPCAANFWLVGEGDREGTVYAVWPDASGRFELNGIEPGEYTAIPHARYGWWVDPLTHRGRFGAPDGAPVVRIPDGVDLVEPDIALPPE